MASTDSDAFFSLHSGCSAAFKAVFWRLTLTLGKALLPP